MDTAGPLLARGADEHGLVAVRGKARLCLEAPATLCLCFLMSFLALGLCVPLPQYTLGGVNSGKAFS